jgi:hypothetical protein
MSSVPEGEGVQEALPGAQLEILVREVRAAARAELTAKQVWHEVCALAARPVSFARVERVVRRARVLERESASVNDENIAFVLNTVGSSCLRGHARRH